MYNFKTRMLCILEICSHEIKWISPKSGRVHTVPLPQGVIEQGKIKQFDALQSAWLRLVKEAEAKRQTVSLSLAQELVLSKKIQMPATLTEKECEAEITANLDQYFARNNEECVFDFMMQPGGESDQVEVLIVAVPLSQINTYQALAAQAGLSIGVISSSVTSLKINLLPWRDKKRLRHKRIKQAVLIALIGCLLILLCIRIYPFSKPTALPAVPQPSREAINHWIAERKLLHELQYVGYLQQTDKTWGLIKFSKGDIKEVKLNDYIGVGGFKVANLTEDAIVLRANHHHDFILQRNH